MGTAVCLCKRCFLFPLCRLCRKTTRRWPPCRKPSPRTSSSPTWTTTRGGRSFCQWLPWLALQWLRVLSWVLKGTPGWRRMLAWERRRCAGVFFCRLCVVVLSMLMLRKDLFCFQLQPFRFALYQWKAENGRLVTYCTQVCHKCPVMLMMSQTAVYKMAALTALFLRPWKVS